MRVFRDLFSFFCLFLVIFVRIFIILLLFNKLLFGILIFFCVCVEIW